jgi:hypothetical protein
MSHLSRDERLLALDGALDAARQAHLAACTACRTEVDGLRRVLAQVRAVDVPEPSPLFWDHLAARVGDAIAREPAPAASRAWWSPRLAWAALAVVCVAATAGYLTQSAAPPAAPVVAQTAPLPASPGASAAAPAVEDGREAGFDLPIGDDSWALLAAVAEGAAADGTGADETFVPAAGQVELSISSLSAAERRALAGELTAALAPGRIREG